MTKFEIVALYIAIFIIMNLVLMLRVGGLRNKIKVSIGDGGDKLLLSRVRAHGNFIETIFFAIIALFTLAQLNAPVWALHFVGALSVIGRSLHAWGMSGKHSVGPGRPAGMLLFMITMLFTAGYILYVIALK